MYRGRTASQSSPLLGRPDPLPSETRSPSALLRNSDFLDCILDGVALAEDKVELLLNADEDAVTGACASAEALLARTRPRLHEFHRSSERIKKDSHRSALCWKFKAENLGALCAIAVVLGHIGASEEVRAKAASDCLLAQPKHRDARGGSFTAVPEGNNGIATLQRSS